MFKNAYDIASKFTLPLVVTIRFHDKTVESGLGSFIVLNNEGWLMSVAQRRYLEKTLEENAKNVPEYGEKLQCKVHHA